MKKYFLLIILFFGLIIKSQDISCYYDKDWKTTTKDKAEYYRTITKDRNSLYHIQDFYISGELQFSGFSKEKTCDTEKFIGEASWYNKSGFKNQTYVFDENSNVIERNEFDINFLNDAVPFRKGNKWGLADYKDAKILIEPKYDSVTHFWSNEKLFYNNGKAGLLYYGYLNENNPKIFKGELLPSNFDSLHRYFDGYRVYKNGKYGYYDLEGNVILSPIYKDIICQHYINKDNYFIIVFGNEEFSDGIYDVENKKFIVSQSYKIVEIDSDFVKKINEKFKNEFYDLIFIDKANKIFALDKFQKLVNISLIKLNENINKKKYEVHRSPVGKFYEISYSNSKSLINHYKTIDNKKYKSLKGVSYLLTDVVIGKYTLIKNLKNEKFGLIKTNSSDFKNVSLEPNYDDIKAKMLKESYYNNEVPDNFFIIKNGEKEGLFANDRLILDTKAEKINMGEDIVTYVNKDLVGVIFFNENNSVVNVSPKKMYKIQEGFSGINQVKFYKIFLNKSLYYYINNLGVEFYTP